MDLLPSSRLTKGGTSTRGPWLGGVVLNWVPIFCANCGTDGGKVPEENHDFAFFLCEPCAETFGQLAGTMLVPDEVFWHKVEEYQREHYGRVLHHHEIVALLSDERSALSRLAHDRPRFG